ncbi:MAG: hypothetical protein Ct9H300mP7_3380 [Verrucomicrobiota bacterium]|nr:MAG: hypothetical protein Ct9H300mP7_3380 [Verrucomicrobiota bacterium]
MTITETGGDKRVWDVAKDISGNILEGNPLKDSHGHAGVWYFFSGNFADVTKVSGGLMTVPTGSLLSSWKAKGERDQAPGLAKRSRQWPQALRSPSPDRLTRYCCSISKKSRCPGVLTAYLKR